MTNSPNNLRLFHVAIPGFVHSRSFRCIWLLEELGVDNFDVYMLSTKETFATQMKKYGVKHAFKIPVLQMGGQEITESGVICQVLAEHYQSQCNLLGKPNERIEMLQWLAIAETCITFRAPLLTRLLNVDKTLAELQAEVIQPSRESFQKNIAVFEEHFEERGTDYLLESGFSVADAMCGWSLHTFNAWGILDLNKGESPKTLAYLERLQARAGFKQAEKYSEATPGLYERGCVPIA